MTETDITVVKKATAHSYRSNNNTHRDEKEHRIQSTQEETREKRNNRRMRAFLNPSLDHLTANEVRLVFSGEFFESLVLGLGNQEGREDTRQHEESENLENVLDEFVCTTDITELSETDLSNDSSKFAGSSRDTVCSRTVPSWESLTRYNESGGVGAEVLEEVGQAVEEDEGLGGGGGGGELVVTETHDDEEDGKHDEAHKLNGLATPAVDEDEGDPVSGDETGDGENQVSDADVPEVVEDLVGSAAAGSSETDGGQDDG